MTPPAARAPRTGPRSAPRTGRVPPLPPEERRAAIIAATLPLVRNRGFAVTTKEIAAAAGVAEGTIFRVFDDKNDLFCAVVDAAFDPAPFEEALAALSQIRDLRTRLTAAVTVLLDGLSEVWRVLVAVRTSSPYGRERGASRGRTARGPATEKRQRVHRERQERIAAAVATLFEPDVQMLRVPPPVAARYLTALVTGASHPAYVGADPTVDPMPPEEIVAALLDGVLGAAVPAATVTSLTSARVARTRGRQSTDFSDSRTTTRKDG